MENTPMGYADDLPTSLNILKNREASTFFSAAGFCPKQYKIFYLPAKAPPIPASKFYREAFEIIGAGLAQCFKSDSYVIFASAYFKSSGHPSF